MDGVRSTATTVPLVSRYQARLHTIYIYQAYNKIKAPTPLWTEPVQCQSVFMTTTGSECVIVDPVSCSARQRNRVSSRLCSTWVVPIGPRPPGTPTWTLCKTVRLQFLLLIVVLGTTLRSAFGNSFLIISGLTKVHAGRLPLSGLTLNPRLALALVSIIHLPWNSTLPACVLAGRTVFD